MQQDGGQPERVDRDRLRELSSLDSATLHEAAGQTGAMEAGMRPLEPGCRIAGRALTVACPAGDNLMLHAALAQAVPGEVLVAQCHDHEHGVWGEVMTTSALARGVAGLIVDGGVRDVSAIRAAGFPVFCRGISIRGTTKAKRGLLRQPISCGGILVWPGDYVIADDSGVVAIGEHEIDVVLERARQRRRKEGVMMAALRERETTLDLLGLREVLDRGLR